MGHKWLCANLKCFRYFWASNATTLESGFSYADVFSYFMFGPMEHTRFGTSKVEIAPIETWYRNSPPSDVISHRTKLRDHLSIRSLVFSERKTFTECVITVSIFRVQRKFVTEFISCSELRTNGLKFLDQSWSLCNVRRYLFS